MKSIIRIESDGYNKSFKNFVVKSLSLNKISLKLSNDSSRSRLFNAVSLSALIESTKSNKSQRTLCRIRFGWFCSADLREKFFSQNLNNQREKEERNDRPLSKEARKLRRMSRTSFVSFAKIKIFLKMSELLRNSRKAS
jgi:hypothetical protein